MKTLVVFAALASVVLTPAAHAAEPLPTYDSTQIEYDRYVVVKRLGVEGWRSAFNIPGHRDEESARRALSAEALRAGADALINVYCLGQTDAIFKPAGYYCYGNAIRIKNEQRVKG